MQNKYKVWIVVIIIFASWMFAMNGLNPYENHDPKNIRVTEPILYTQDPLMIGIIGEIPTVREKIITFEQIQFKDLENAEIGSIYDAVIITKDNLSEAAQDKYAPIYKSAKIPFFFLGSQKDSLPFTEENLSYEDAPIVNTNMFYESVSYRNATTEVGGCATDVPDPIMTDDAYTSIFQHIHDNKQIK